jgi:hypothetical protein
LRKARIHCSSDALDNQNSTTRTVTPDSTAPLISELAPDEGNVVEGTAANIQGRVVDATAITVRVY